MLRPTLTTELFNTSAICGQPMIDELKVCMVEYDFTFSMYCGYLTQYFKPDSIEEIVKPFWIATYLALKSHHDKFTNKELYDFHNKYMETYDKLIDTEYAWLLTASYDVLSNLVNQSTNDMVIIHASFMIIYKLHVFEIEAVNDYMKDVMFV